MLRPLRDYRLTFVREGERVEVVQSGRTPCQARSAAYRAFEQQLIREKRPLIGWRLTAQADVTHLRTV